MTKKILTWQSSKNALFVFLPFFILTSSVLWTFYHFEMKSKKTLLQIQASHTINLQQSSIAKNFNLIVADLLFFANYSQMFAMFENSGPNKQHISNDFSLFSRGAKIYDQVRIINADGKEGVRVNFSADKVPVVVEEESLQVKKDRYYFQDTFSLNKNEIFVSPLDLNIEHGEIEKPLKPMIRFGSPIFDKKGQKRGIVIFNYLAANLIKDIKKLKKSSSSQCMLLNSDSYWLVNQFAPKLEWGFMYETGKNSTMKTMEPKIWQKIKADDSGQFSNGNGLYSFTTIYPLHESWKSSTGTGKAFAPSLTNKEAEEYFWKLVLFLPDDLLITGPVKIRITYIVFNLLAFIFLAVAAVLFAQARLAEQKATKSLHQSHTELETRVKARTAELEKAKKFSETITNSMLDAIAIINVDDFTIQQVNPAFLKAHELVEPEVLGKTCYEVTHNLSSPCTEPDHFCPLLEALEEKETRIVEHIHFKADGRKIFEEVCATPIKNESGKIVQVIHLSRDITERKKLQEQYLQAQKMESVGRLVGGVAHDFNNLLSIIIGYSELVILEFSGNSLEKEKVKAIYQAGKKAAGLTRQLLAFSRKQVMEMKSVDINIIIDNLAKMIGRMIGEDVKLILHNKSSVGNIKADPTQLEQILINLSVNAKDAMPNGGSLIFETTIVTLDADYDLQIPGIASGSYVLLTVTDTGVGMTKSVQKNIFEPFFTTKGKGRGTGLGLSTIYGIVKQHNGHIYVYSEPEKGTVFKIYFPQSSEPADKEKISTKQWTPKQGTETILVVDDEPQIVKIVTDCMLPLGYKMLSASDPEKTIEISKNSKDKIDLLLTDVIMPKMNGRKLAEVLCSERPSMKVVYMSGYTDDIISHHGFLKKGIHYITKPLIPSQLIHKLQDVLDGME